jgi:hypothetical protein
MEPAVRNRIHRFNIVDVQKATGWQRPLPMVARLATKILFDLKMWLQHRADSTHTLCPRLSVEVLPYRR